jgi:type VII secretion-associated protein (TIGR03931 family)
MSGHPAIIEAGPATMRRLCCGTGMVVDAADICGTALGAIDDHVALVDGRPVAVGSLWCAALRLLDCRSPEARKTMLVVHPSWWPSSRIGVVTAAAKTLADDVLVRPRSWLLTQASNAGPDAALVVEIAERLVAIAGAEIVAVPRGKECRTVAEEIAGVIAGMARGTTSVVLIDAPSTVAGASALASLTAGAARSSGLTVVEIDDTRLSRLAISARSTLSAQDEPPQPQSDAGARAVRSRAQLFKGLAAAAVVLAATAPAVAGMGRHGLAAVKTAPTRFLVEGRVALTVPENWTTQRVVAGPGSARVQVTSPSDPEVALHVTQSRVPDETLSATADRLKRAIDSEPGGVFVDFNPAGISAGRPAVTYREVRADHQVRWTVLLDGAVRISIGCQSRPGGEDAVRDVCEQAVRSAHSIG